MIETLQEYLRNAVHRIQRKLAFQDWQDYPQFATRESLGRSALIGTILGLLCGLHLTILFQCCLYSLGVLPITAALAKATILPWLLQWSAYAVALTSFHLLEFFITALYNPTVANADSFLVNHSTAYTVAAITSWLEFVLRWAWSSATNSSSSSSSSSSSVTTTGWIPFLGLLLVILGQTLRSLAMATAGESFHHLIQTSRHDKHVLITHGVYHFLRHPSYTGFFYWSVGTQLLLGNVFHSVAFLAAAWTFFRRRIPYEEETLCRHFPQEYPAYRDRTYVGIPFLDVAIRNDRDGGTKKRN